MNFKIQNKSDETATIDILGDIGEGWFDEGITMTSINDQLKQITSQNIILNISSLGGDLTHALTIYDLLRSHKANITSKIMGATASSGTIIAMAGDKIEMSDNALFLVHNASSFAGGNADDLREQAEALDKFDDRIINIYKKKTGKAKSKISSLMAEDKWIDAKEAKSFGFIDKIYDAGKVLNKKTIENINNSKYLPNIKDKKMNKDLKNINALLEVDGFESTDDGTFMNNEQLTAIDAKLAESVQTVAESTEAHETAINDINAKNETAINDLKAKYELEVETAKNSNIEALNAKITEFDELKANFDAYVLENPAKSAENDIEKEDEIEQEKVITMKGLIEFEPSQKRVLASIKK